MSIAFVIQTYKGLDQVERLARTLARGTSDRWVVVTHNGSEHERRRLAAAEGVDHALLSPGGRGRFGVIDGLISAMRWLERQPKPYRWLVVLSGQDFPIRPLAELEAELRDSDLDGYFHHFEALNAADASAPPMFWTPALVDERYHFKYATFKENPQRLDRYALWPIRKALSLVTRDVSIHTGLGLMLGTRAKSNPFSPDFRLFGGSYWMTISRNAVRSVLNFTDARPDVVDYFRQVICPEESFIHSVLGNDPALKLTRRELRFVEFDQTNHGYVTEFGSSDLPRLMESGRFIARKFDFSRDPNLGDALEAIALGKT